MSQDSVLLERRGAVARVTLNRPDVLNSFDNPMFERFLAVLDEVRADRSLRALYLTGAGRGFCAGQDISGGVPEGPYGAHLEKHWNPVARGLRTLDIPVVVAVNGVAAGAGANVALAADFVIAADGRVVVYSGDDERGEFLYRFVSDSPYVAGGNNGDLLDSGRLQVAKFHDDMTGEWLDLTPETTGIASMAEVLIHARMAASAVGATTMDRPEWVAVNPTRAEAYCALTNNRNRGVKPNAGGDATPVGGPNPRAENNYGQIVRWVPEGGDHAAPGFTWDLFVTAGNPTVHDDAYAGSANVTADNMFNSPDGIAFDPTGVLWIQTDGNYGNEGDFAGQGNNQMLAADPGTGEIRRFLVGPVACEVTGLAWSADRRTMFVGIQHPGEDGVTSHFPGGGQSVARSTVIAVRRSDGGPVG